MPTVPLMMVLSPWEPTPSVDSTEFAPILTLAMLPPITLVVLTTLEKRIAKPMVLAKLASPMLTVEFSMVELLSDNLPATLPQEPVDLAKRMPIVQLALLTVEPMEAAMLVILDLPTNNADLVSMVVKFPDNLTAILSLIPVFHSALMTEIV